MINSESERKSQSIKTMMKIQLKEKCLEQYVRLRKHSNYAVSNWGKVLNIKTQKFLKGSPDSGGYIQVCLYLNGVHSTIVGHRLVGFCFLENPDNLPELDHIDQQKTNNYIQNLRWSSRKANLMNKPKRMKNNGKPATSKYRGVSQKGQTLRWRAFVSVDGKAVHIGYYENEIEAGQSYNEYVIANNLPNQLNAIVNE